MIDPDRPRLLVSVRSAEEAREALAGGASVVDVKEPDRGPLGRADPDTWQAVRDSIPSGVPVSVALGELADWIDNPADLDRVTGLDFYKLGLAGAGSDWVARWAAIREASKVGPRWVAVAYDDWQAAGAPSPSEVLKAALEAVDCRGILLDTYDKTNPSSIDASSRWVEWVDEAKRGGLLVALAGGLDLASIARLAPLRPDLFAVRGAACDDSDRRGRVRADRVAGLVRAIRGEGPSVKS